MIRNWAALGLFLCFAFSCEASCSFGKKIDGKKLEERIKSNFADQGGIIKSATCPKDVKLETGLTFTCEAIAENGDILKLEFEQTDAKGNVKIKTADELVVMKKVVAGIESMIKKNEAAAKIGFGNVKCPPDKKGVKDAHFECTAEAAERKLVIGVDESDNKGNVIYAVTHLEITPKALAERLVADLAAQKISAKVDCGTEAVKLIDKQVVQCAAVNDKGEKALVAITPSGNLGAFSWEVKAPGSAPAPPK